MKQGRASAFIPRVNSRTRTHEKTDQCLISTAGCKVKWLASAIVDCVVRALDIIKLYTEHKRHDPFPCLASLSSNLFRLSLSCNLFSR